MAVENLTTEDVAASAYRACCYAAQVEAPPSWEGENLDTMQRWLHLAGRAQTGLEDFHGKPYAQGASWLFGVWAQEEGAYEKLPLPLKLCWEAVTRHLVTLLDAEKEDLEDLTSLEKSWGEWHKERMKKYAGSSV